MRRSVVHVGLGMVCGAVVASGVMAAVASIPGSDGKIKGCYAKTNGIILGVPHTKGELRVVDSAETCRSYEAAISWPAQAAPAGGQLYVKRDHEVPVESGALAEILRLDVPAGSYAIDAKTEAVLDASTSDDFGYFECDLSTGDRTHLVLANKFETVQLILTDAATFTTPTTITLKCGGFGSILDPILRATSVSAIH